jgi:CRISPR/Cas system CSM-associated protein Csm3 (group 7 of RAMP superfamily)
MGFYLEIRKNRNYLREVEEGYGVEYPGYDDDAAKKAEAKLYSSLLFGASRYDDSGSQSPLIIHDALGIAKGIELRDGVAIDPETRTAEDGAKFDIQLLSAGSTFKLQFELLISKNDNEEELLKALTTTLQGLEEGQITLGARKRRGYGECKVENWTVQQYKLEEKKDLLAWLSNERSWKTESTTEAKNGESIKELLGSELVKDAREYLHLKAIFGIEGTLLIRSGSNTVDAAPDSVHMHARHKSGGAVPVIPGTSWAGVLRHRALKIAHTVSDYDKKLSQKFIDNLFGPSETEDKKDVRASRVTFKETEIKKSEALVITRVKIDRFTGGAYEGALFSEQPTIGTDETEVTLDLYLRTPKEADAGLILLLLKDLWTGDLPIGGQSGVGRGRLKGKRATLTGKLGKWNFKADGEKVIVSPETNELEKYVKAFNTALNNGGVA